MVLGAMELTKKLYEEAEMPESSEILRYLQGYRITTVRIFFWMPDYESLLQEFIRQMPDLAPKYPETRRFLDFWEAKIEARIHSVEIAQASPPKPILRFPGYAGRLH